MYSRKTSLALLAATTLVVAGCSNNDSRKPMQPAANLPPVVAMIANVTTNQDTMVGPLAFSVSDDTTPASQLTVTAAVDGASPFPADGVQLGGTGGTRTIAMTPLEASTGTTAVTVTVVDAQGLKTVSSFSILVNARNASVRDVVTSTFAKGEVEDATNLNGFTFAQDADDPATFAGLVGEP